MESLGLEWAMESEVVREDPCPMLLTALFPCSPLWQQPCYHLASICLADGMFWDAAASDSFSYGIGMGLGHYPIAV